MCHLHHTAQLGDHVICFWRMEICKVVRKKTVPMILRCELSTQSGNEGKGVRPYSNSDW